MLIYSKEITPRIEYIFLLILNEILGISISFTSDWDKFDAFEGPKINYSFLPSKAGWVVLPVGLLFESTVKEQYIEVFDYKEGKAFFKTSENAQIPFDLFAASFYLISRYEEYLPYKADKHGRFPASESLAFKNNFLHQPVINIWAEDLKEALLKHYPDLKLKTGKYRFLHTVDVDNGYAYLGKSWWRTSGAIARYFLKLDFKKLTERLSVVFGFGKDPYDKYDFQKAIQLKYNFSSLYFLLCGKPSKNDHNILPQSKAYKRLVNTLTEFVEIGLHPSYLSGTNPEQVKVEKETLERVSGKQIVKSRQHFLKLKLPRSYSILIKTGIMEDYTMGYASHPGFRAGICTAFKFYNLEEEKKTRLTIFPFAIMDVTFSDYMNLNTKEIIAHIKPIIEQVKKVNGLFISVWHDRSFADQGKLKEWKTVYEKMLEMAVEDKRNIRLD